MPKRVEVGVVKATRRPRPVASRSHAREGSKYGKYLRRRTVCYVHDENNESAVGDTVEIRESRPRSRLKRWELVRIVTKSQLVDRAALRAGRTEAEGT